MFQRADAEQLCKCLSKVREGLTRPQIGASTHGRAEHQQRNMLARVVGAWRGRIVAVIGGDDQQIAGLDPRQQRRQSRVESLEVGGVALGIVAMPVHGVKVDQVGEDQASRCRVERALDFVHAVRIAGRVHRVRNTAAGKQVLDLADGDNRRPGRP